ncbi:MAG: phosphopantothenoylcysteine decarboxylase [Micrococcaceae bacterium]
MNIVITAGGTREAIDPVRYIHNKSSGKQGIALVEEAVKQGHQVTLIHTLESEKVQHLKAHLIRVDSAEQMYHEVHLAMQTADALIMCAAVADYTPVEVSTTKVKKTDAPEITLTLKKTKDILASFKDSNKIIVGFAAETGDSKHTVLEYGLKKLKKKACDMLVVNEVAENKAFGQDTNTIDLIFKDERQAIHTSGSKNAVAAVIIQQLSQLKKQVNTRS